MYEQYRYLLEKIFDYPGNKDLTLEEIDFMHNYMTRGTYKNYAFGVLPYITEDEKRLADSIAKKLNLNKFYRGPRYDKRKFINQHFYSKATHTLKEDAVAVALYVKP